LAGIEELKGLINTLVSNVSEDFIEQLRPKASKLFFVSAEDKDALYYREKIFEKISETFKEDLAKTPDGTAFRTNGTWYVGQPNFSRKEGRRIFWTTRISIEVEAGTLAKESGLRPTSQILAQPASPAPMRQEGQTLASGLTNLYALAGDSPFYGGGFDWGSLSSALTSPAEKKVVSQKGRDIFEILWSAEVTTNKSFKKIEVHEIKHIGLKMQPAS
jgi:hypothetical protein